MTLAIGDRLVKTSSSTIALAHVTRAEISQQVLVRETSRKTSRLPKYVLSLLPLIFATTAYVVVSDRDALRLSGFLLACGIALLISAGIWILMSRKEPKEQTFVLHELALSTSDGHTARFASENGAAVEEAWRQITDRMSGAGAREVVTINFASEPAAGSVSEGPTTAAKASPSQFAPAPARSQGSHFERPPVGMTGYRSQHSASKTGAQPRSTSPATETFVDFSAVLPAIVEMHRFYARQPGALHLEQRLSELELLMRAGTPTTSQKARLKELAIDMSQILQAYPQAVELFDHVGELAA